CAADGEPEGRALFEERSGQAVGGDRIQERRVVGERRSIHYDRRLQIVAKDLGIVGPVYPEGRVHHRKQDLQFDAGGYARCLRPGAITALPEKPACGYSPFNSLTRSGFIRNCPGKTSLLMPKWLNGGATLPP